MNALRKSVHTGISGLYAVLWTLIATTMILTGWLILSTDLVLRPTAVHYEGNELTLVRETPFGDVWGQWNIEIRVPHENIDCTSGPRWAPYQQKADNTVIAYLGVWAQPCLSAGPPLVIVNTWQAWLFGVIPLRPTSITTVVELPKEGGKK